MMRVQFAEEDYKHDLMNTALKASSHFSKISKFKNEHFSVQSIFWGIFDELNKWYIKQTQPTISHTDVAPLIRKIKTKDVALITTPGVIKTYLEKTTPLVEEANSAIDELHGQ